MIGKLVLTLLFLSAIIVLWGAYHYTSRMSYSINIEYDPYRKPMFIVTWVLTVFLIGVIADVWFTWIPALW